MRRNLYTVIVSVPERSCLDDAVALEKDLKDDVFGSLVRVEEVERGTVRHKGRDMTFMEE